MGRLITYLREGDRWIPSLIVVFFLSLALIDGVFVYVALKTHTGTVIDRPYERGKAYNDVLERAAKQDRLGWSVEFDITPSGMLAVSALDAYKNPIDSASVHAEFTRPTMGGFDFSSHLTPDYDGNYIAKIEPPMKGQWNVRVFVEWQGQKFQKSKLVVLN
jgi:nitrogen fixation protein FixH